MAAVPEEAEFHNNLGLALAAADRIDEAIAAYRRALALKPDMRSRGTISGSRCRRRIDCPKRSTRSAGRSRSRPTSRRRTGTSGLALLADQDFAEGWREYEWRYRAPEFAQLVRSWPGPRWDGADPAGRTLLRDLGARAWATRFSSSASRQPLAARGARVLS